MGDIKGRVSDCLVHLKFGGSGPQVAVVAWMAWCGHAPWFAVIRRDAASSRLSTRRDDWQIKGDNDGRR